MEIRYYGTIAGIILIIFAALFVFEIKKGKKAAAEDQQEQVVLLKTPDPINSSNSSLDSEELNTINLYKTISPAVVNINTYKTEFIEYFFEVQPHTSEGQGSGVIFDKEGYIITNYHVVGNADRLSVVLSTEGPDYEAKIVGTDPENDLAIIKLVDPPKNLKVIPFGNSDTLLVGQKVYAIGNPFGLERTITAGIISALGRELKTDKNTIIEGAIQTDASINPGNSGGPLLNSSGQMIGINTMIISPSRGSVGLGFSIPVNKAKEIIPELLEYGYVRRGWIDATFLPINSRISRQLNYRVDYGLMVMQVARGGQAEEAGFKGGNKKAIYGSRIVYVGGEIITKVEGVKMTSYSDLVQVLKEKKPGEKVKVEYYKGNKKFTTDVTLIDKTNFEQ